MLTSDPAYFFEFVCEQDKLHRTYDLGMAYADKTLTDIFGKVLLSQEFKALQARYSTLQDKIVLASKEGIALEKQVPTEDQATALREKAVAASKKGEKEYQAALNEQKKLVDDLELIPDKVKAKIKEIEDAKKERKVVETKVYELIKTVSPELL